MMKDNDLIFYSSSSLQNGISYTVSTDSMMIRTTLLDSYNVSVGSTPVGNIE